MTYSYVFFLFCFLFDLIFYVPVNNFSVMLGRVFLGWSSTKQGLMCFAKGHNAMTPVRLEPGTPRSLVMHSTTEFPTSCLFDLIHYFPVNNLSVMSGRVFLGWTSTKQGLMCFAQGHYAVTRMRLKPATPWSLVKHSTTESLRSLHLCWHIAIKFLTKSI